MTLPIQAHVRALMEIYDPNTLSVGLWDGSLSTGALVIGAVTQSGNWDIRNITGTVSLPTGAAKETKQDTIITALASLLTELQAKTEPADAQNVLGPVTDAQLRASNVGVSLAAETVKLIGQVIVASGTVTAVTSITNPISSKTDLTPSAPTVTTVGISSASAVAANSSRKGLIVRNVATTGQRISLGFGQTAVLDSGVTLYPQDTFSMNEYDFDLGAVNAIASAASANLAIQEYA